MPGNLPVTVETLEARPRPRLGPASALTDASPSCRIKEALSGKSPAPLDVLSLTLPELDQPIFVSSVIGPFCCFILKLLTTHTDRSRLPKHALAQLPPPLMSFLTLQMQPGIPADDRPPWEVGILHQHNERPAGGPDWRVGFQEPQTDVASDWVCSGEDADKLDVYLHVQLPQGEDGRAFGVKGRACWLQPCAIFCRKLWASLSSFCCVQSSSRSTRAPSMPLRERRATHSMRSGCFVRMLRLGHRSE